jgi:hypothetical protein
MTVVVIISPLPEGLLPKKPLDASQLWRKPAEVNEKTHIPLHEHNNWSKMSTTSQ